MKINTILIDDEQKSVSILCNKLERHCPQIEIIATTNDPESGIGLIDELEPDLVFLDVSMPRMSGLELLKHFPAAQFEVIFVTAFNQHAIEAINLSACGYILKPFDNDDLVQAVERAILKIQKKNTFQEKKFLLNRLNLAGDKNQKIVIPNREGIDFVKTNDIIHCEGVEGYTKVHLANGKKILSSQSIGNFAKLLDNKQFFQVHKSHIINLDRIVQYLNEGYLVLENGSKVPISRQRREDFFEELKIHFFKK